MIGFRICSKHFEPKIKYGSIPTIFTNYQIGNSHLGFLSQNNGCSETPKTILVQPLRELVCIHMHYLCIIKFVFNLTFSSVCRIVHVVLVPKITNMQIRDP